MIEVISAILLFGGAVFMLITAVGVLRMPDFFMRMHVITKSGTLGVGLIFLAVALHFGNLSTVTHALVTILFVLLTAPVSAHLIGRAGYIYRVPLWKGTLLDELRGYYDVRAGDFQEEASAPVAEGRERGTARDPTLGM